MEEKIYLPGINCTLPSIEEFPDDLFTEEQRKNGYIAIHFALSLYLFYALAIVTDEYFIPSVGAIAKRFKIPSEIAGCTIMGIANSSPELFTNIIGTFGAIVGCSVFNLLFVAACIGLATGKVNIESWPVTRDSFFYMISVIALFGILFDHEIEWWDGLMLLVLYGVYIISICFNKKLKAIFYDSVESARKSISKLNTKSNSFDVWSTQNGKSPLASISSLSTSFEGESIEESFAEDEEIMKPFKLPSDSSWLVWTNWIVGWPIRLVYFFTIPDCQQWKKCYPLTFLICIGWNTGLCYLVSWMMTVIGHTFGLPDSIMGLTLIAAGTSVPQAVGSIIVARKGLGTMAMNNAIGSNITNILVCLGGPWLVQAIIKKVKSGMTIDVHSNALEYSTLMLLGSAIILYAMIACNHFKIDRKLAVAALIFYAIFLIIGSMFELNVFFHVNDKTCPTGSY